MYIKSVEIPNPDTKVTDKEKVNKYYKSPLKI